MNIFIIFIISYIEENVRNIYLIFEDSMGTFS